MDSRVADKLLKTHFHHVPVLVHPIDKNAPIIKKHKFLAVRDKSFAQFQYRLRDYFEKLHPDDALFFFIDNQLPVMSQSMAQIYKEFHCETTHFLYVKYGKQSTFG